MTGVETYRDDPIPQCGGHCCPGPGDYLMCGDASMQLSDTFKALSDPTRVRILHYLACSSRSTACACHLPDMLGISQPTMSFHIKKLVEAGLLERRREGRWALYSINQETISQLRGFLDEISRSAPNGSCSDS